MKEQAHNEIDLMLRKLGSASGGTSENGNHSATSSNSDEHLDADELNMYAENALPLKTRARYTEHLADCQQCRQIVSQLSQAAGIVVVEEKKEAVQKKSSLSEFFGSLFSPMVLKYALPAVLLITVASIGFFTLRSSRSGNADVAQSKAVPTNNPGSEAQTTSSPVQAYRGIAQPDKQVKASEPKASPEERSSAAGPTDAKKEAKREAPTTVDDLAANADTPAAPAPPVGRHDVASKKPAETEEKRPESKEVAGNKNTSVEGADTSSIAKSQPRAAAKVDEANKKLEDDEAESRKARSAPAGRAQSQTQARGEQQQEPFRDRGRRRQDKDDIEIRSVAGRSFHRENGVWIDAAYNSSNAMTRVSRGSEQFRALVADEPEIKRIADQLPGDVIVVWKGRVYRIQ